MENLIFTVLLTILSFYCGIKIEKQRWINNSNENCLLKINNHFYKVIKDDIAKVFTEKAIKIDKVFNIMENNILENNKKFTEELLINKIMENK